MVRLRATRLLHAHSLGSHHDSHTASPLTSRLQPPCLPPLLLMLLRVHVMLTFLLVAIDAASSNMSSKAYTRHGIEALKALLFWAVSIVMPSRDPALFVRLAVVWMVLTFGYSLLLPVVIFLRAERRRSSNRRSSMWGEEWLRFLIVLNALAGMMIVVKMCLYQGAFRRLLHEDTHKRKRRIRERQMKEQ